MKIKLDSNTDSLKCREKLNARGERFNLEEWIFQQIKPKKGMSVLDLGCGTGKQIFAIADAVSPGGLIVGLDISDAAVEIVNETAKKRNLDNVKAIKGSLDDCVNLLADSQFDLILSSYAIYYASDMKNLLIQLKKILKPKGQIFVCGYGAGTNHEMTEIINKVSPAEKAKPVGDFISEREINEIGSHYSRIRTIRLHNTIRFDSAEDVLAWWKNHNSFIPEIADAVKKEVEIRTRQNNGFSITKNVLGVHILY